MTQLAAQRSVPHSQRIFIIDGYSSIYNKSRYGYPGIEAVVQPSLDVTHKPQSGTFSSLSGFGRTESACTQTHHEVLVEIAVWDKGSRLCLLLSTAFSMSLGRYFDISSEQGRRHKHKHA